MGASSPIEAIRNLKKYALVEKLGEGYLGSVYRGFDQDLGRAVVVRILCNGIKWNANVEELFYRECRSVAGLQHPSIAAVFDVGKEGQDHYIVMESLGSSSFESLIRQKSTMSVEAKLSIMIQVAEGLSYAHKNGVLHRDLSPGKIHLTTDGNVKIRDFAITHVLMKHLPHPVVRWGAPIYMSPEQIQHKDCDERSDIFSAGMVFYELLTNFHPLHDPNGNKALDNILQDAQIPTFERFPEVPPGLWPILKTCLARDPTDRYRSMEELSNACRELLKSLAEDTQLMLAELYAALIPLRKAAARPNAPEDATRLLQDIERLSRGDKEADYTSLDRLMTVLIEQYPTIQAAAGALEPVSLQHPPEEMEAAIAPQIGQVSPEEPIEATEASPQEQSSASVPILSGPDPAVELPGIPQMPLTGNAATEDRTESHETGFMKIGDLQSELEKSRMIPHSEQESALSAAAGSKDDAALPSQPVVQDLKITEELPPQTTSTLRYRRIPMPSYRSAVVLLSILVIAAAAYIALGTEGREPVQNAWNLFLTNSHLGTKAPVSQTGSGNAGNAATAAGAEKAQEAPIRNPDSILLKEAQTLAAENRFAESRVLLRRALEINPTDEAAIAALKEVEEKSAAVNRGTAGSMPPQELLARASALIDSDKLVPAKMEIDKLQRGYPAAPEVLKLRKRWLAKSSKEAQEQARKEEEQQKAAWRQKEDDWNRQLADLFTRGKYNEANSALHLWLAENPGSPRAQEFSAKIEEIQHGLKDYASAMYDGRYQDALNAIRSAEKINPGDSSFAELHRQVDVRKAAARAMLTVHRLGAKGVLLLDGRPIGNDGEVESESIPIGSHTLAIENEGNLVASRNQEYLEGQRVILAYDLARMNLRPMSEADRELLAQRKEMEGVHRFEMEHDHGILRGSCRGVLSIDSLDVAYKPSSGWHGFRVPLKLLKLKVEGRSADLSYISDNKHFQSFKLQDQQMAERLMRLWSELKAIAR